MKSMKCQGKMCEIYQMSRLYVLNLSNVEERVCNLSGFEERVCNL